MMGLHARGGVRVSLLFCCRINHGNTLLTIPPSRTFPFEKLLCVRVHVLWDYRRSPPRA